MTKDYIGYYHCPFPGCRLKFTKEIGTALPRSQLGKPARHGGVTTQVVCPGCGNFLKTDSHYKTGKIRGIKAFRKYRKGGIA